MKVRINNLNVNLKAQELLNAKVSFGMNGREFCIRTSGRGINISLNALIEAINNSKKEDRQELDEFRQLLRNMREKGYADKEIKNSCIIVRIVNHILHHFSKGKYHALMRDLNSDFTQETLDKWNTDFNKIIDKHIQAGTKPKGSKLKKLRRALYQETKKRADKGYFIDDQLVELDFKTTLNMQFFQKRFENGNLPPSTLPNPNYKAAYEVVDEDTLDLAETYLKEGLRPAALNLANAYQPGGGVEQGCSAQEESIFRRTNYHQALYPQAANLYPIDKAEAIYTPYVQVFRTAERNFTKENQKESYQYRKPFTLDLIACAAVDLRGKTQEPDDYETLMREKIRLMLAIAVDQGHDSLVLGAFGCGAFKNDPAKVSLYFKEALEADEFRGRFKKVGFGIIHNPQLLTTFENQFLMF